MECDDIITNPICSNCLANEMHILIDEYDPTLNQFIQGFNGEGSVECIRCSQTMNVCSFCFGRDTVEIIEEKDTKVAEVIAELFQLDRDPFAHIS